MSLRRSHERTIGGWEGFWVASGLTVVVCEAADGTVEFALQYESDVDELRRVIERA